MPGGAKLVFGDGSSVITAAFKWCVSTQCLGDYDLSEANLKTLHGKSAAGRLVYKTASQADVSIPVSFRGLSDALDALLKQ
jgi:invasion protein IalB